MIPSTTAEDARTATKERVLLPFQLALGSVSSVGHTAVSDCKYFLYECCTRCLCERFFVLDSTDVHDPGIIGTELNAGHTLQQARA